MNRIFSNLEFTEIKIYYQVISICAAILYGITWLNDVFFALNERQLDWLYYIAIGTVFPAAILAFVFFKDKKDKGKNSKLSDMFVVATICFLLINLVINNAFGISFVEQIAAFICVVLQIIILALIGRTRNAKTRYINPLRLNRVNFIVAFILFFLILYVSWSLGYRLITNRYGWLDNLYTIEWWFWPGWLKNQPNFLQPAFIRRSIFLTIVTIFVTFHIFQASPLFVRTRLNISYSNDRKKYLLLLLDMIFLIFLFISCIDTEQKLNTDIQAHTDFFLGPIMSVRQGGWLLWDQPSGYGFLWVLIAAAIPIKNTVLLFSVFLFALNYSLSVFLYKIFCDFNPVSIANRFFSFALVVACFSVKLFQNQDLDLGPLRGEFTDGFLTWYWIDAMNIPQSSAIRSIICCILLYVASRYALSDSTELKKISIYGCFFWSVGCLWSAESAVFCTATWVPCFVFIVIAKKKIKWLNFWVLSLIVPIVLISAYYYLYLQQFPEWTRLFEFVYTSGVNVVHAKLSRSGPIWIGLGLLVTVAIITIMLVIRDVRDSAISACLASFGAIWSVTSYYISDSHNSKFMVMLHVYALAVIVLINVLKQHNTLFLSKSVLSVFLIVVLISGLDADRVGLTRFFESKLIRISTYFDLTSHRPPIPDTLKSLFAEANVKPSDAIMLANSMQIIPAWDTTEGYISDYKLWLPFTPSLPDNRRIEYATRFVQRRCTGGWLVSPTTILFPELLFQTNHVVVRDISLFFKKTKEYSNLEWILSYYEPIPSFIGCQFDVNP